MRKFLRQGGKKLGKQSEEILLRKRSEGQRGRDWASGEHTAYKEGLSISRMLRFASN